MPTLKNINAYIKALQENHAHGGVGEHSHRPALQALLESAIPGAQIINEPSQIKCGAPDFVLTRNQIPFGYIETKDIGKNLDDKAYKEQLNRYTDSLNNLLFTDYLEFRHFRDGEHVSTVVIGEIVKGKIKLKRENLAAFSDMLETFAGYEGQTITTANGLATQMALKARMLAMVITRALAQDENATGENSASNNALTAQLDTFKKYLIHDLKPEGFADIYAQTVAYGMFAARLHDPTPQTFSRKEAAELIPTTNPFLRKFFQHIAGYDLDRRIHWIVDDLADLFRAADVGELMKGYGKATQHNDPFLHFYETFLGEYNPKLRKSRGVYYTPEPVVNFIVRAVDEILRTEFKLPKGLADTGKTTIKADGGKKEVHKVQILDPATGTGTFLAAIVQEICAKYFANKKGIWPDYVKNDLIPRLNGFEVLMASYAMAHTKLEMVLRDSGCELKNDRLRVFLTNSLEAHHPDTDTIFAQWLSAEANKANFIKRDTPVMVVIGNPPYSGESANQGEWISCLIDSYKREPSGGPLQEINPQWINDDYVKFIRYGQYYIDKTGEGVLAYINNHSFLDNPTFRGMRWSLLQSFDKMYIIDLHGSSMRRETSPDGSPDKNVFDIRQGVSINLFIKTGKKQKGELGQVSHFDLYGERESKYQFLWDNELSEVNFKKLKPVAPQYYFVPKDYKLQAEYNEGFSVKNLFEVNGVGVTTAHDEFSINMNKKTLLKTYTEFQKSDRNADVLHQKFDVKKKKGWNILSGYDNIKNEKDIGKYIKPISYRPFDNRFIFYENKLVWRAVDKIMWHFLEGENVGLIFCRQVKAGKNYQHVLVTKNIFESSLVSNKTSEVGYGFPLYIYPNGDLQTVANDRTRKPNLNKDIIQKITDNLGLQCVDEKESSRTTYTPIDILDYTYAVLYSPAYRSKYTESLKIDFPRVPYPADSKTFRKLAKLGAELRALHLMESHVLNEPITGYPEIGDNIVIKPKYKITNTKTRVGKVEINDKQYFDKVPESAWNFPIGGYLPAQKWLKDRKDQKLGADDIEHYQKIIVALTETARIMEKIGEVDFMKKS